MIIGEMAGLLGKFKSSSPEFTSVSASASDSAPSYHRPPFRGPRSRDSTTANVGGLYIASALQRIRRNDRLLRTLPPYVSLLCIVIGVVWLFMLPLDGYSRRTYISENALLPGQVHAYFGGSDQHIFRAYRHEIDALQNSTNVE